MATAVDSIPPELSQLITSRLLPSDCRSLCASSSTFGQQSCGELITRLALSLPDLRQCRLQQQKRHDRGGAAQHCLSHVTALTITGPPDIQETHDQQSQLVLFVLLTMPPMVRLTTLSLHHMLLSSLVAAAAGLSAACPQLTHLRLQDVTHKPEQGEHLSDLWAALVTVRSLRHLKVVAAGRKCLTPGPEDEGLPGLGAVTQLRTMCLNGEELLLQELSQLVGLSKLTVSRIVGGATGIDGPHLGGLTRLQRLKLRDGNLSPLTALRHLTSLRTKDNLFDDPSLQLLRSVLTAQTGLVRVSACNATFSAADLLALPFLRDLQCVGIILPAAAAVAAAAPTPPVSVSRVVMAHVRVIKCQWFECPTSATDGSALPPQCVAETFPLLSALKHGIQLDKDAKDEELWPTTPAGQLLHLQSLCTICLTLSSSLAHCAVALEDVVIKAQAIGDTQIDSKLMQTLLLLGPQLRRVELRGTNVGDATLVELACSWRLVEEVTIRGVNHMEAITDLGVSSLLRLPRLRRVTLVKCSAVTPSAIAALAARWSVERIEVCACPLVGAAEVDSIWRLFGRPQLEIVHSGAVQKLVPWAESLECACE